MIASLRQNLSRLSFKNSSSFGKSDAVCSLLLLHFSTSGESQSGIHPTVYEFLVHNHQFSPESASQIASVVTHLRNPEKSDSLLWFLKQSGFSNSQLEKTVRGRPELLSANLEKYIKPKVKIFKDFGLSGSDVAEILSNNPSILKRSVNNRIIPSLSVLRSLFGANELAKLLKGSYDFFMMNFDISLVPNVRLLKKCGVSMDQIIWMMYHIPRSLLRKQEDMKKFVDKADEMGVSRTSKRFIHALRVISAFSDETWELKLRTLRELGFSDDDIARAFRKCPLVFSLSVQCWERKVRALRELGFLDDDIADVFRKSPKVFGLSGERMKEAKEVLLANRKYDLSSIISIPTSLMYSIEKRH